MSKLKNEIDVIMEKIDVMDHSLDDYDGSPEDQLRRQALALLASDPNEALRYFATCGTEHFEYFLGFLPDLCELADLDKDQEELFMTEMERIANQRSSDPQKLELYRELLQYRRL